VEPQAEQAQVHLLLVQVYFMLVAVVVDEMVPPVPAALVLGEMVVLLLAIHLQPESRIAEVVAVAEALVGAVVAGQA